MWFAKGGPCIYQSHINQIRTGFGFAVESGLMATGPQAECGVVMTAPAEQRSWQRWTGTGG